MESQPSIDITKLVNELRWDEQFLDHHCLGEISDAGSEEDPMRFILQYVEQFHGFYLTVLYKGQSIASHRINLDSSKIGSTLQLRDPHIIKIITMNIASLQSQMEQNVLNVENPALTNSRNVIEISCAP